MPTFSARRRIPRRLPKRGKRAVGARSRADRQLAQGTGRVATRAFGAPKSRATSLAAWDAFSPAHAPLPRATGPYTVIKTTLLHSTSAKYVQLGAFQRADGQTWSNIVGFEDVVAGNPISGAGNVRIIAVPFPGVSIVGSAHTCVPSAISVQVMNPEALQTTHGILAAAVATTQLDLNNRAETFNDISSEFISYFKPRLLSAGKLALRGVQMDSFPLNMSEVSDFKALTSSASGGASDLNGNVFKPTGWAPIVIINEQGVGLELLITVEWRVRFDIGNPAVASHRHHGVTSDHDWNRMLTAAIDRGNGVLDIVERVASMGQAMGEFMRPLMA